MNREDLKNIRQELQRAGKRVVFTNGCFDIIHRGHVEYLTAARALGDALVVGMNTDASVRRVKGAGRPIVDEDDRAHVLAAFASVNFVTLFDEETPLELIRAVVPDVLVKGGDWPLDKIVGKDVVEQAGGSVRTIPFLSNRSTTAIVKRIRESGGA